MGRGDKPGQDEPGWSQNRKYDRDIPGYAPRPRGGPKPVRLDNIRGANAYTRVWRPGFGWKPAFTRAGNSIGGALKQAEQASLSLTNALRATAGLGPIGGGGGGDPKSQKKR